MRKPIHSETQIQSKYQVETQTDPPNPYNTERPNPTKKPKRYNIIPHLIALCVIMANEPSAYALSFNLNTGDGTGMGTLTIVDTGTQDSSDGYTEYDVSAITGTFDTQTITGIDPVFASPDNLIEIDTNGNILVDSNGLSFDTANNGIYNIYQNGIGYGPAANIENESYTFNSVTSFTGPAPTTPVPFQAPLADAIPVIGSVLVLGALRKVRNFKKA